MTYNLKDIELMISNLPKYGTISSLDATFTPKRRHVKAKVWHLNFHTRPRKIINCFIEYSHSNQTELELTESSIPFFLRLVRGQFFEDKDVKRLLEISNIETITHS